MLLLLKVTGLYYFAKEVRRRARIRIAVNRSWAHIDDYRYNKKLADTIDFTVDENRGAVAFDVGGGLPYAVVENMPKGQATEMYGNPTMRFTWYRIGGKAMKINRPGFVVRYGINFFTGAYEGALDDFDKICFWLNLG